MSKDTIYRQDAIDALMVAVDDVGVLDGNDIKAVFDNLPSVEPEIIRCRDCKHHDGIRCFRWNSTIITGFDDFCSNAERRSEEE